MYKQLLVVNIIIVSLILSGCMTTRAQKEFTSFADKKELVFQNTNQIFVRFEDDNPEYTKLKERLGFPKGDANLTMSARMNENHLTDSEKVILLKGYDAWDKCCKYVFFSSWHSLYPSPYRQYMDNSHKEYDSKNASNFALLLTDKITIGEYLSKKEEMLQHYINKFNEIEAAYISSLDEKHKAEVASFHRVMENYQRQQAITAAKQSTTTCNVFGNQVVCNTF